VALVLAEPAMTNVGFLLPQPGFHDELRRLTREAGTLLAIDETHSLVCSYAGLAGEWHLEPDFLVVGKSIAAGVPLAAYGMRDADRRPHRPAGGGARRLRRRGRRGRHRRDAVRQRALDGGRARRAARRPHPRGLRAHGRARRADGRGLRAAIARAGLPWSVVQHGAHAFYFFVPEPPVDDAGSRAADDPDLRALIRVFMANRGVWESGWWLGPTLSVAHGPDEVDSYVANFEDFLTEVT
jgi:glutamate-1-semialdehyde aminotransferase